jgi:hypothetical protein
MITHILLWNYRPDVSAEERAAIETELMALPAAVPALPPLLGEPESPVTPAPEESPPTAPAPPVPP